MSIYGMIYDELQSKIEHLPKEYKKYTPAFDLLDREDIAGLELDESSNTFWYEFSIYGHPSQQALNRLTHYLTTHKGYKYLYA